MIILVKTEDIEAKAVILGTAYREAVHAQSKPTADGLHRIFQPTDYANLVAIWTPERYGRVLQELQQGCKSCGG